MQQQDRERAAGRSGVGRQHERLFRQTVDQRSGEKTHKRIRNRGGGRQQRDGRCAAGLPIGVNHQRQRGHRAADLGKRLAEPENQKDPEVTKINRNIHKTLLILTTESLRERTSKVPAGTVRRAFGLHANRRRGGTSHGARQGRAVSGRFSWRVSFYCFS